MTTPTSIHRAPERRTLPQQQASCSPRWFIPFEHSHCLWIKLHAGGSAAQE